MDSTQPLLSIQHLQLTRNTMAVVTDGHLAIHTGELVCLTGPNGSGKSSLAEMLAGLPTVQIKEGSLIFKDQNLVPLSMAERARLGLYVAFQQVPVFDTVVTKTFLYEAYVARFGNRIDTAFFSSLVNELVAFVGLQPEHLDRPLFKGFSGGERKRLLLLELLLLQPTVAVLDEVDAGLDQQGLQTFFTVIEKLQAQHTACLIITHNKEVLQKLNPSRCYRLHDKQLEEGAL